MIIPLCDLSAISVVPRRRVVLAVHGSVNEPYSCMCDLVCKDVFAERHDPRGKFAKEDLSRWSLSLIDSLRVKNVPGREE